MCMTLGTILKAFLFFMKKRFYTLAEIVSLVEKAGFSFRRGCSALFWGPDTPPTNRSKVETGIVSEAGFVGLLFENHQAGV